MSSPLVSCVTPTYKRHRFLPMLYHQFCEQTYKGPMEWIILDDTPDGPWLEAKSICAKDKRVRYIYQPETWLSIAKKRNMLTDLAKGSIICYMDDDDYQFPDRVKESVKKLETCDVAQLAGSTILLVYELQKGIGYELGPYQPIKPYRNTKNNTMHNVSGHFTCGTLAARIEYLRENRYDENTGKNTGEEYSLSHGFSKPVVQLDPFKTIVCINWRMSDGTGNTFNKRNILQDKHAKRYKLKDLIRDKKMLAFYREIQPLMDFKDAPLGSLPMPTQPISDIPVSKPEIQKNGTPLHPIEEDEKTSSKVQVLGDSE